MLLVQTSDDMEDVIDVSSDNLARLKEEAAMLDATAIIRYIRIFSDLSGQIRYATQKRILIEIALIRLCRPQMEIQTDALLDRIRNLEEKIEKGVVVQAAVPGGTIPGADSTKKTKPELPKAIPEDVQQLVQRWPEVVGDTAYPMKSYLKSAKLSLAADGSLLVVLEDGVASDYFIKNEENRQILQQQASQMIGKEVAITYQAIGSRQDFDTSFPDLTQLIQMDIEQDDGEEEPEPF